ncbi:MAG: WD40 repeat domain-containing protein [Cyanobacteria bacterium J06635_15]
MKSAPLQFTPQASDNLTDYVTVITWSPDGEWLAVASSAGEVVLTRSIGEIVTLQAASGQAINGLGFSADGQFLTAGGQSGKVMVWDVKSPDYPIVLHHDHPSIWIDRLAWHPSQSYLAYGVGSQVHIWDVAGSVRVANLDFQDSSILHLAWHPNGESLAVSGHGGIKVWFGDDWITGPKLIAVPGASLYAAWSDDGRYLGSGNLDRTLTVAEWNSPPPWLMQGFPGKVRQVTWSTPVTASGAPLIAAACVEAITVWERHDKAKVGWRSRVLEHHKDRVNAIAFQPNSLTLASAGQDGRIALWQNAQKLSQTLKGFSGGATCLAWSVSGDRLAVGGTAGELRIWQVSHRAKGFG